MIDYTYCAEVLSVGPKDQISMNIDLGFSTWRVVDIQIANGTKFNVSWNSVRRKLHPHTPVVLTTQYQRPSKRGGKRIYTAEVWIDGLYLPDYIERERG